MSKPHDIIVQACRRGKWTQNWTRLRLRLTRSHDKTVPRGIRQLGMSAKQGRELPSLFCVESKHQDRKLFFEKMTSVAQSVFSALGGF